MNQADEKFQIQNENLESLLDNLRIVDINVSDLEEGDFRTTLTFTDLSEEERGWIMDFIHELDF